MAAGGEKRRRPGGRPRNGPTAHESSRRSRRPPARLLSSGAEIDHQPGRLQFAEELGATIIRPAASDPIARIEETVRDRRTTQVLMSREFGEARGGLMRRSIADDVERALPDVELHLIGGGKGRDQVPAR